MSPRHSQPDRWPWRHTMTQAMGAARRERGTVLLMVVGVLALLAIIGVVYATIGRADRSISATTRRQQVVNDQADEIAAYLATVIGNSTFARYAEPTEDVSPYTNGKLRLRQRGYTYPWTDEYFLSFDPSRYAAAQGVQSLPALPSNANLHTTFAPTGDNPDIWRGANTSPDPRNFSDPYLAVLEPEWLRLTNPVGGGELYDRRDWRHISVFAPSGNFVNLANLRRSNNGGFDAPPGFAPASGSTPSGMSYGLTLRNKNGGSMYPHTANQLLPDGTRANPAVPAHWSNNQILAYRPAVPDAAPLTVYQPGDWEYVLNQWADADGDGFLDSRWFELTDLSGMFGVNSVVKQVVPARGRYRLFCAARCIDNSAKINVNVACDLLQGPFPSKVTDPGNFVGTNPNGTNRYLTRENALPPGISPADIALNRVLRLSDVNVALDTLSGPAVNAYGYQGIPQPAANAADRNTTNYSNYNKAGANPTTNRVGDASYAAIIDARRRGATSLDGTDLSTAYATNAAERYQHYDLFAADPHAARASIAYGSTVTTPSGPATDENRRALRSPFDLSDELELAAYFGVNDSDTLSRFEATVASGAGISGFGTFSPLRDNRPRSLEMTGRDELDGAAMASAAGRSSLLAAFTDVRHLLTTVNGSTPRKDEGVAPGNPVANASRPWASPNPFVITDVSSALAAISNYSRFSRAPVSTDPARGAGTPFSTPTKDEYDAYQRAVKYIFQLYANALAPYTEINEFPSAWMDGSGPAKREGLVYGGNSELAIRMAAHMTANLVDAFDRDRTLDASTAGKGRPNQADRNETTALVVQLAQTPQTNGTIGGYTPNQSLKRAYQNLPTLNLNDGLAVTGTSRLPQQPSALPSATPRYTQMSGKMTVFGIEAQPFLTEVGTMALYTDAPQAAGGDKDWDDEDPTGVTPQTTKITMRLEPSFTNDDFLCEVIAFQLHNPFDQDLILFDSAATNDPLKRNKYYIEFCARYYSFGKQDDNVVGFDGGAPTVRLKAGHTQTFYTINPGTLKAAGQRLKHINIHSNHEQNTAWSTDDDYTNAIKTWVERQLQSTGADAPIQLTQISPRTFQAIANPSTTPDMDIWGQDGSALSLDNVTTAPHGTAEMRVCQLWKTMRGPNSLYPNTLPGGAATDEIPAGPSDENDPTNDFLADRLHDPSDPLTHAKGYLFYVRNDFGSTNRDVTGAVGGDEEGPASGVRENTGYSAIVWAAIRRPTDEKQSTTSRVGGTLDSNGRPIRGALPPWCLEARSDAKTPAAGAKYLNKTDRCFSSLGGEADFTSAGPERFKKLRQAIEATAAANPEIGKPCFKKGQNGWSNPIGVTRDDNVALRRPYSDVAVEFHSVGEDQFGGPEIPDDGTAPSGAAIRRSRNPLLFSRSGDFLLPLAVGPWFDPSRRGTQLAAASTNASAWLGTGTQLIAGDREAAWMTLSESLALACGYYSPEDPKDPLYEFGVFAPDRGNIQAHVPKADRGHLVLNAFTPYLQIQDGQPQPLGSGVPFALSIIDQFRAAPGISSTPKLVRPDVADVVAPEQQTRATSYGGGSTDLTKVSSVAALTRREGFMNLNTLTLNGMRTLPLIAPEDDAASWIRNKGSFFSTSANNAALFDFATSADYDLAPTLKAYRDRSKEEYRKLGTLPARQVDFMGVNARLSLTQPPDTLPRALDPYRREGLGFKSLGEVAAVNVYGSHTRTLPAGSDTIPSVDPNSMFRFSEPEWNGSNVKVASGTLGTTRDAQRSSFTPWLFSSNFYNIESIKGEPDKIGAKTFTTATGAPMYAMGDNELPGGYQQKLAIINALTNTASVRSDVFTVYFVIHGYTPEDCDVEPDQPLVPSVAKRYVMVVDRSNVQTAGDKPRILMLKEVPMQ